MSNKTNITAENLTIDQIRDACTWGLITRNTLRMALHGPDGAKLKARKCVAKAINVSGYDSNGVAFSQTWAA